ncbi:HIRAN domain-containing protein [Rhizorhabdus wittichii]|uniref:HIRAN domain-containing protein n=1 Tax=Rhizorhabdus wittichii TaxID=160791 RepID=A0A975D2Y5_9SPHN|nr:HIRAN domain-containing protein [Rhizorhabdus wittichii]QTH22027.1 HIRAN domain-containing protein [Rhizorhabdus wittichii]
MGWNDFRLAARGERYPNADGSSRQDELRRCARGERVALIREPTNEYDPAAVAIFSCRGIQLGYLAADHAGWIGSKIDRGYDVRAIVERVKGAHLEGATLGLVILINMEGDDPTLDGEASQPFDPAEAIAA